MASRDGERLSTALACAQGTTALGCEAGGVGVVWRGGGLDGVEAGMVVLCRLRGNRVRRVMHGYVCER